MTWIRIDDTLCDNPKLAALADELADELEREEPEPEDRLIAALVRLWLWAMVNAGELGDVGRFRSRVIARAAGWRGDPDRFVEALGRVGWLDQDGNLNDWADHSGVYFRERARSRRRRLEAAAAAEPRPDRGATAARGEESRGEKKRGEKRASGRAARRYTPAVAFAPGSSGRTRILGLFSELTEAELERELEKADEKYRRENDPSTFKRVESWVRKWLSNELARRPKAGGRHRVRAGSGKYAKRDEEVIR